MKYKAPPYRTYQAEDGCTGQFLPACPRLSLRLKRFIKETGGDAMVEAAIIFPIIIMIFAALVLLSVYLPTRAALQRATQYAATALATEDSDAWLFFDEDTMSFYWEHNKRNLRNVYAALFSSSKYMRDKAEKIVANIEGNSISAKTGRLSVDCHVSNKIVYKEIVVIAAREFTAPVDLSFIRFPKTITVTASSTAVVQNGDEFVRNMDMTADLIEFITIKFGLTGITDDISSFKGKMESFLGW